MKKILVFFIMLLLLLSSCGRKKTYQITFDSNGGTPITEQRVKKGEVAVEPSDPVKEGYTFLYWTLNDQKFDFSTPITSNITLVAKWEENNKVTEGLEYKLINNSEYEVIGYTGESTKINIPSLYNGLPVTSIADRVFYQNYNITSITIPETIVRIGEYAFYECYKVSNVFIPSSVISIEKNAFSDCENLVLYCEPEFRPGGWDERFTNETVHWGINENNFVEENNIQYILDTENFTATLVRCKGSSEKVVIPSYVELNNKQYNVIKIENWAFYFFDIIGPSSVVISEGVTSIDNCAFSGCSSLTSITIPDSVTSIGDRTFESCNKLEYNTYDNAKYLGNDKNPYLLLVGYISGDIVNCKIHPNTKFIYASAFSWCRNLTSIEIPSSVTSIGNSAFYGCTDLISVSIPNSVTSIGFEAFFNCYKLEYNTYDNAKYLGNEKNPYLLLVSSINKDIVNCKIHPNTKFISTSAFSGCSSLTSITIPNGVTSIGNYAFYGCTDLISVSIPNSVTRIENYSFSGCSSLTSVTIPNSVISIGEYAFSGCSSLTSITIPNSITSIGTAAFSGCSNLSNIIVDENNPFFDSRDNCNAIIKTDSNNLITGCKNTVIPSSVTSIGEYAFWWCSNLTSIVIPNSVTSIEEYTFSGCSSLTSIEIPSSVISIEYHAFSGCSSLTSIVIPDSVTSIGEYAFDGCSSLISIEIPASVTSIGDLAFRSCSSLSNIIVDENNPVFDSRDNCNAIIKTDSNKLITGCKNTVIPNSVTSIASYAFFECSRLTSIVIPNSITSIGEYTFFGCSSLTIYCEVSSRPSGWDSSWNSGRPVTWGYEK